MLSGDMDYSAISGLLSQRISGLRGVYLFGSFASGNADERSDLDVAFLAESAQPFSLRLQLSTELTQLLRRDVDLLDLQQISTVMRMQIINRGQRIYCADESRCEAFEDFVFADYARLNEERAEILADVMARGSIYG